MTVITLPASNSLRARAMRWSAAHLIAPIFRTGHTPEVQRRKLAQVSRLAQILVPSGTQRSDHPLAGVAAEWTENVLTGVRGHLLYIHGGAFVLGSPATHRNLTNHLAKQCRVRVVSVDYRLAPAHPFPAATDDVLSAYRALLDSGVPAQEIVIAGDSAGGGLTMAGALAIRDAGLPLPAGLVCISPWVDLTLSGDSMMAQPPRDIILTREVLAGAAQLYLGAASPQQALASPLFADLRGLPPLLIQVTDAEALYDDSTRLEAAATKQGVTVQLEVSPNLWHDWQIFAGQMPEADAAVRRIAQFIDERLAD